MILKDILGKTTQFFKDKNLSTPRLDAELLISDVLGFQRIELYTNHLYPLEKNQVDRCREYVKRRSQGEPVAYILGYKDFYRERFLVDENVLVPRPETELLVEEALEILKNEFDDDSFKVADFGCGSGCIGLSLAKTELINQLYLIDISEKAIHISQKNAEKLELSEKVHFINKSIQGIDEEDVLTASLDLVVANPPYINREGEDYDEEVEAFEPEIALFSDEDGLKDEKSWAKKAKLLLKPGGYYLTEIGYDQGELLTEFFKSEVGFSQAKIIKDYSQFDRIIVAKN